MLVASEIVQLFDYPTPIYRKSIARRHVTLAIYIILSLSL